MLKPKTIASRDLANLRFMPVRYQLPPFKRPRFRARILAKRSSASRTQLLTRIFAAKPYVPRKKRTSLLDQESCGNFLIQEGQIYPQQIWKTSRHLRTVLTQISVLTGRRAKERLMYLLRVKK